MSQTKINAEQDKDLQKYLKRIQNRITKYNQLSAPTPLDNKQLIDDLYLFTQTYLKKACTNDADNFKVIQLFRHGECTNADKGYGFKPNANINPAADANMKHFDYSVLLHNQSNDAHVVFSTMTRATVTAANFIKGLRTHNKKVTAKSSREITEIAEGPSGFDIMNWREYGPLLNPFSDVKFLHRALLFFSFIRYAIFGSTLEDNKSAKQTALDTIGALDETSQPSDVTHTTDAQRENGLAKEIVDELDNDEPRDMVVIGHGNSIRDTLTKLFPGYKAEHRKDDALDFAESQALMAFDVNGKKELFMLPFRIQVDQHTPGKMNVRYVPYAELNPDYQQVAQEVTDRDLEITGWQVDETDALLEQNPNRSYGTMRLLNFGGKQRSELPELVITESDTQEYGSEQDEDELGFHPQPGTKLGNSGSFG
ncbi:hypothetical protein FOLKNPGA_00403 [Legionella sp. PC1000]|uniref:hypothetical protein n=1 Tax=Legionella sp. PC1000 TaxID=2746060 RepID=UPI0015F9B673|nr:hypothetical protein [Legionella sp. PC1000]QLZ67630.1 hypothetical protein FOLKNPGA_00403 [Legionella sp. PC1000]